MCCNSHSVFGIATFCGCPVGVDVVFTDRCDRDSGRDSDRRQRCCGCCCCCNGRSGRSDCDRDQRSGGSGCSCQR